MSETKEDRRWRVTPSTDDEEWMAQRVKATYRDERSIVSELIQRGMRSFDKAYGFNPIKGVKRHGAKSS